MFTAVVIGAERVAQMASLDLIIGRCTFASTSMIQMYDVVFFTGAKLPESHDLNSIGGFIKSALSHQDIIPPQMAVGTDSQGSS